MMGYQWYEIAAAILIGLGGGFLLFRIAFRAGYFMGYRNGVIAERQRLCPHKQEWDDCPDCRH